MKLPSVIPPVFRGRAGEPPGIVAVARVDRATKIITKRLNRGEIAIIDHSDLDRVSAEELIRRKISAVVNVSMSITGRYPGQQARLPGTRTTYRSLSNSCSSLGCHLDGGAGRAA